MKEFFLIVNFLKILVFERDKHDRVKKFKANFNADAYAY